MLVPDLTLLPLAPEKTSSSVPRVRVGVPAKDADAENEWNHSLFGVFAAYECGFGCCVQHCFCQPCVVGSSLSKAGYANSALVSVGLVAGGGLLSGIAAYIARRQVNDKYALNEDACVSILAAFCCASFSNVQVVSTIAQKEKLKYGCAAMVRS